MVRDAFDHYDTEHNGHIASERLGDVMRNLGHRLTREELRELIEDVDKDSEIWYFNIFHLLYYKREVTELMLYHLDIL